VAARIVARHDPRDSERLLDLTDRLLVAGRGDEALRICRGIEKCPAPDVAEGHVPGSVLTNGNFAMAPTGHGFDWHVSAPVGMRFRWDTGSLTWIPDGSEPEEYALLEQWIVVGARRYRLHFEYAAPGIGLRWAMSPWGAEQSSPALAASSAWRQAEWNFRAPQKRLARLRFVYRREAGSTRLRGDVRVRNVKLECL
jgi:hypothetical protein